jgi:hypothetical protein
MRKKLILLIGVSLVCNLAYSQVDRFEGRTTTANADIASAKENVPVKKESFTSKLERFKKEGFKVAVVLNSSSISSKREVITTSAGKQTGITQIEIEGSIPSMKEHFSPLVISLATELNKEFNTDLFEVVNMDNIPYTEDKWGNKKDDWGSTKYRMVVSYEVHPEFDYYFVNLEKVYKASLKTDLYIYILEYINTKKGVKQKNSLTAGMGYYSTDVVKTENDPNIANIEELKSLVSPPSGEDIAVELQNLQNKSMTDFISKCRKK